MGRLLVFLFFFLNKVWLKYDWLKKKNGHCSNTMLAILSPQCLNGPYSSLDPIGQPTEDPNVAFNTQPYLSNAVMSQVSWFLCRDNTRQNKFLLFFFFLNCNQMTQIKYYQPDFHCCIVKNTNSKKLQQIWNQTHLIFNNSSKVKHEETWC